MSHRQHQRRQRRGQVVVRRRQSLTMSLSGTEAGCGATTGSSVAAATVISTSPSSYRRKRQGRYTCRREKEMKTMTLHRHEASYLPDRAKYVSRDCHHYGTQYASDNLDYVRQRATVSKSSSPHMYAVMVSEDEKPRLWRRCDIGKAEDAQTSFARAEWEHACSNAMKSSSVATMHSQTTVSSSLRQHNRQRAEAKNSAGVANLSFRKHMGDSYVDSKCS
jgi:hypothetical protein